jgi:hypothetical protein
MGYPNQDHKPRPIDCADIVTVHLDPRRANPLNHQAHS